MKEELSNIADRIKDRKGGLILFFGFYLIFFVFILLIIKNINDKVGPEPLKYSTNLLENSNYYYNYNVLDNENNLSFHGYNDMPNEELNKYEYYKLLDLYSIKSLINNSKNMQADEMFLYELSNTSLSEFLEETRDIEDLTNKIIILTDDNLNVIGFNIDLSNYFGYPYKIDASYEIIKGETDGENNIS